MIERRAWVSTEEEDMEVVHAYFLSVLAKMSHDIMLDRHMTLEQKRVAIRFAVRWFKGRRYK